MPIHHHEDGTFGRYFSSDRADCCAGDKLKCESWAHPTSNTCTTKKRIAVLLVGRAQLSHLSLSPVQESALKKNACQKCRRVGGESQIEYYMA